MIRAKNIRQVFTYAILLLSSFWIFFFLNESSMGAEGFVLLIVLLLANLNYRSIRDVLFPTLLTAFFIISLLLSGRFFERDSYNIPYKFVVKFVVYSFTTMCASAMYGLEIRQRRRVVLTALITVFVSCAVSFCYATFVVHFTIRTCMELEVTQMMTFDQLYAMPVLLPSLVFFYAKYRRQMKHKVWYVLLLVTGFVFILGSMLATATILSIGGVAICFLMISFERGNKKAVVIATALFVAAVLFFLFREQLGELAYGLTENMNTALQGRLRRVFDIIFATQHKNAYSMDRRFELAEYSLDTFRLHPILGVGVGGIRYGVIGYHQEWPDLLGVCGIVGTVIVMVSFTDTFRRIKRRTSDRSDRRSFYLSCFILFILGWLDPCLGFPQMYSVMVILPNLSVLVRREERLTQYE